MFEHFGDTTMFSTRLERMLQKILANSKERRNDGKDYYYNLSPTCQIPHLAKIYEQYFGKKSDGTFVEVGAYDGEYVSNTSGLADLGWKGYYIEPVPKHFEMCKRRHRSNTNVTVSNLAIGECDKEVEMTIAGPLSTISNRMYDNFKRLDWASPTFESSERTKVRMTTLENYLEVKGIKQSFELLVIDVEGYEWNVIKRCNIQKWAPQMVIIELHDQNEDYYLIRDECNKIVEYFDKNQYKIIYKDFSNTIYVPKNHFPVNI